MTCAVWSSRELRIFLQCCASHSKVMAISVAPTVLGSLVRLCRLNHGNFNDWRNLFEMRLQCLSIATNVVLKGEVMETRVSDRIRKARRKAGLSQLQAAELLGIHRGTFGHWERGGGHLPTSANLLRLAQTLDVSYEWLATGHGHMQDHPLDSEMPAVRLDCFAQSEQEESLLRSFRKLTAARRKTLVDLIEVHAS